MMSGLQKAGGVVVGVRVDAELRPNGTGQGIPWRPSS